MGTPGRELLGVGLGMENAEQARRVPRFVLQRQHPDGVRWIEVRSYEQKKDAEAALATIVDQSEDPDTYRVHKLR